MKLSEEIRKQCNTGLKQCEERGMKYNTIWDVLIAIKDNCKIIERSEVDKESYELTIDMNYQEIYKLEEKNKQLLEALIEEVKHCINDTGNYSIKSVDLIEKITGKKME